MSDTTPTPVDVLRESGIEFTLSSHVPIVGRSDAEQHLGLPTEQLLKTMVFRTVDGDFVLAALPADRRVHYGKLAKATGVSRGRLRQAESHELHLLGMEPGGASPVCGVDGVLVVFDSLVAEMGVVYCGSGRADQTVCTRADHLLDVVSPVLAPIVAD